MNQEKKSILEIVLMPIVISLIGILATVTITVVQLNSAEKKAASTLASAEKMALAEQQLKILDIVKDKLLSKSEEDRKFAVNLLSLLSPDLAVKLASFVKSDKT
jgi:hypothetical protein